jgi:hypothetical protein
MSSKLVTWHYGIMARIFMGQEARGLYLDIDARCAGVCPNPIDARYVAEEVQRVVHQIAMNPEQPWLQRYRVSWATTNLKYVVVIPSATGVEYDAAVVWTYRASDNQPVVLAINLQYVR